MYEGLSTREIVAWIACLVIAAGLIVLVAVYLVNSDLTADVLPAAKPAENAALPAARMQLGADDPKIATAAAMPA
jgi:hypothetical protein